MKMKIIGIFVSALLIATTILPIVNGINIIESGEHNMLDDVDQQQTHDSGAFLFILVSQWAAQSFKPTLSVLTKVELKCVEWGHADKDITISIRSSLSGNDLTSLTVPPGELPLHDWYEFDFPDIAVTPGDTYYIVLRSNEHSDSYGWVMSDQNLYARGEGWRKVNNEWVHLYSSSMPYYDFCFITYGYYNSPPDSPDTPSGPQVVKVGKSYPYSTSTIDPDGDDVYYWFDWDDGTNSGWVGPYSSGATVSASHAWYDIGSFAIRVKAKDDPNGDGDLSDGSESWYSGTIIVVSIPKSRVISTPLIRFLESHPNMFLILRNLLGL